MILWLEVDSVEDLADFGLAGANPDENSKNFPVEIRQNYEKYNFLVVYPFIFYESGWKIVQTGLQRHFRPLPGPGDPKKYRKIRKMGPQASRAQGPYFRHFFL